mmetsp:Transcript_28798/g.75556  ORF Transcript_28798/g.75556 Transcript_28798/m.75556 type:complete len:245 (+) Transcript_28798:99-833(+)
MQVWSAATIMTGPALCGRSWWRPHGRELLLPHTSVPKRGFADVPRTRGPSGSGAWCRTRASIPSTCATQARRPCGTPRPCTASSCGPWQMRQWTVPPALPSRRRASRPRTRPGVAAHPLGKTTCRTPRTGSRDSRAVGRRGSGGRMPPPSPAHLACSLLRRQRPPGVGVHAWPTACCSCSLCSAFAAAPPPPIPAARRPSLGVSWTNLGSTDMMPCRRSAASFVTREDLWGAAVVGVKVGVIRG